MEDMSSKDIDTRDGYNQWSATYEQPALETERMNLEPITETHAQELRDLFSDQKLHHFVPFEPLTLEQQGERCARWAKRQSPDGNEVWLNWAGRDRVSKQVIAHFQSGIKRDGVASVGYLVAEVFQNKGYASEGLEVVFRYLNDHLNVHEVRAWSDTRNKASHRLARRLGMAQVEFIKDADFFKGSSSDEFVFSKILGNCRTWQPPLSGPLIKLRPLVDSDFELLHAAASDPLIWEQHPEADRYKLEKFRKYFQSAMESKGALAILDQRSGGMIGSSRFTSLNTEKSSIEIGYTFLTRDYWGGNYNRELKSLMLGYAFQFVDAVYFFIGDTNQRSRRAIEKLGAAHADTVTTTQLEGNVRTSAVYVLKKVDWAHGVINERI